MHIPLPNHHIAGLALIGTLLTAGVSIALANPAWLPSDDTPPEAPEGAPADQVGFRPHVLYRGHEDEDDEHDEDDEDEDEWWDD